MSYIVEINHPDKLFVENEKDLTAFLTAIKKAKGFEQRGFRVPGVEKKFKTIHFLDTNNCPSFEVTPCHKFPYTLSDFNKFMNQQQKHTETETTE